MPKITKLCLHTEKTVGVAFFPGMVYNSGNIAALPVAAALQLIEL